MAEYEEEIDEIVLEDPEVEPDPIGTYFGGRNEFGERHGRGWAILPNGDQYDGLYKRGKRHGRGLYVFLDGSRYLGNYRCGIKSGQGKFIYLDGSVYEGFWRNNLKHGHGMYTYSNGDIYKGSWYKGKRHGVGVYEWKEMDARFEGTWNCGLRVGPCIVHYGQYKFHGYWDYKYPQGPGVFNFQEKYILNGYYRTDTLFSESKIKTENSGPDATEGSQNDEENICEDNSEMEMNLEIKPSKWISQNIGAYDYSLIPQHPVPLPKSDSEESVCDLDSPVCPITVKKPSQEAFVDLEEEEAKLEETLDECGTVSQEECDFDFEKVDDKTH